MRTHGHGQGYADSISIPELIGALDYSKGPYYADKGDFDTAGAVKIDMSIRCPRPRRGECRHARLLPRLRRHVAP